MILSITAQQLWLGFMCTALLLVRRPLLSNFRSWLLSREIEKCTAKADALGFGSLFQEELAAMFDTAIPGDVFRLFGRLRDITAQQRK